MASLLSYGAGAGEGLDNMLQRMLAEEELSQRAAAQKEAARHNQATEQYNRENMQLQTQLRGDAQQDRWDIAQRAAKDRATGIALKRAEMQPIGALIEEPDAQSQMEAGVPRANFDWDPGTLGATVAPTADAPMGEERPAKLPGFRWVGSQKDINAVDRLALDKLRADRTADYQKTRGDVAKHAEARLTDWGPPVLQIADQNAPGGTGFVTRKEAPGKAAPAPPAQRSQEINNEVSLDQLDRLETMQKGRAGGMTGPIEGRARSAGQGIPGVPVDKDFADFEAATSAFRNAVIKAITGAQMSEVEAKRIRQQIPEVTDKPEVWMSKAAQTRKILEDLNNRLRTKRPGAQPEQGGIPQVGGTFNGGKVTKITPIP
jgi:hypothetical protein